VKLHSEQTAASSKKRLNALAIGFICLLLNISMLTGFLNAQTPKKIRRIGFLSPFSSAATPYQPFREALRDHGWIEGENISILYRYANGAEDRLPGLVTELLNDKADVIVTSVTTDTLAAKNATTTIPIVRRREIRLPQGSLPASPGPMEISPVCPKWRRSLVASGWKCSRKSFPNFHVLRGFGIQRSEYRPSVGRRCKIRLGK